MRRSRLPFLALCCLTALPGAARADTPMLLHAAVEHWTAGKQDLAFTQRARTFHNNGSVKEERLERYDPSLPDDRRWHLLEVNGQPPTEEQRRDIQHSRNRKPRKRANKPPEDLLDFPRATVRAEQPHAITYEVALRPEAARLVQTEKLVLLITVGRESRTIERVTASLREPMRVALGLARITDVDFDLTFDPPLNPGKPVVDDDEPSGTARVALRKLG
ncbi:MAG: hypothetical protein ABIQ12_04705, partial [Opitutaceae bacterium]